jgi:hypothetical protein
MISVIVTITDGDWHLERCLNAIFSQPSDGELQVIVPYIPGRDPVDSAQQFFPLVHFVAVQSAPAPGISAGLDHYTYDLRRAAGLRATKGDIIAMTEDHAIPAPDWIMTIADLHRTLPYSAIGGTIDHTASGLLNWAVYLADFGRYQSPVREGPAQYVSDINISYKRRPLHLVRDSWTDGYHETAVHGRLMSEGNVLWLTPRLRIGYDRGTLPLRRLIRERVAWARLFAARRITTSPVRKRLGFLALTPLLPGLLYYRRIRDAASKGRTGARLWLASPILLFLLVLGAFGEFLGYVTGRAISKVPPVARTTAGAST